MRTLIVLAVFFGMAFAGSALGNVYILVAAPFVGMAVSIVLRLVGWPRKKP